MPGFTGSLSTKGPNSQPMKNHSIHFFTLAPLLLFAFFALTLTAHGATVRANEAFALTWTPGVGPPATHYVVYEIVGGVERFAERTVGTELQVPITPRPIGSHTYVVRAVNGGGASDPSQPLSIIVATDPVPVPDPVPVIPGPVTSLGGVLAGSNVTLTWDARPASEGVSAYAIYESLNGVPVGSSSTTGTTFTKANLAQGVHSFQVSARNAAGAGSRGAVFNVNVGPPPTEEPGAPLNLRKAP